MTHISKEEVARDDREVLPILDTCDDENGNCRRCGHPFDPHIIMAYDVEDFSKGGEMKCQVEGCACFSTVSFNFAQTEF